MQRTDSLFSENATITASTKKFTYTITTPEQLPIVNGKIPNHPGLEIFHCIDRILNGEAALYALDEYIASSSDYSVLEPTVDIDGIRIRREKTYHMEEDNFYLITAKQITPFVYALLRNSPEIAIKLSKLRANVNHEFTIEKMVAENKKSLLLGPTKFDGSFVDILWYRENFTRESGCLYALFENKDLSRYAISVIMSLLQPAIRGGNEHTITHLLCAERIKALTSKRRYVGLTDYIVTEDSLRDEAVLQICSPEALKAELQSHASLANEASTLELMPKLIEGEIDRVKRAIHYFAFMDDKARNTLIDYLQQHLAVFKEFSELAKQHWRTFASSSKYSPKISHDYFSSFPAENRILPNTGGIPTDNINAPQVAAEDKQKKPCIKPITPIFDDPDNEYLNQAFKFH